MKVAFTSTLIFFVFHYAKAENEKIVNFSLVKKFGNRHVIETKIQWLVSLTDSKFIGAFLRNDLILAPFIDQSRIGKNLDIDLETAFGSFKKIANVTSVENYHLIRLDSPLHEIKDFACLPESDTIENQLQIGRLIYVLEISKYNQILYTGKIHENSFSELDIFAKDFGVRLSQEPKDISKTFAVIEENGKLCIVGWWSASLGPGAPNYDPQFSDHIFKKIQAKNE